MPEVRHAGLGAMSHSAGGSRADRPLISLQAEPTFEPGAPLSGSTYNVATECGCAGGQGRSAERVARDGWATGWLLVAFVSGALTALAVMGGSMIGWAP